MRIFPFLFLFGAMGLNVPLKKNIIKNIEYKNYMPPKLLAKNNDDHEENEPFPDPVEIYASFVGFEKEEKWKSVRYTAYYFAAFSLLGDLLNKIQQDMNNPFN
tara:strand:+ start:479 stop:787 length:309 start_codon:yes stop_codon:yes gene_type:complete